ncbi:MAG TPA: DUF433 domain-containing protein [Leptolyngbyaceae cyanobacterium]
MSLQELETELVSLSPDEKVQVIQILTKSLVPLWPELDRVIKILDQTFADEWTGIKKIEGVMGGDACVSNTRIPVWLLVSYRRLGATDTDILQDYPDLSAADLINAFAYAEAHSHEIEMAIRRQKEA